MLNSSSQPTIWIDVDIEVCCNESPTVMFFSGGILDLLYAVLTFINTSLLRMSNIQPKSFCCEEENEEWVGGSVGGVYPLKWLQVQKQ
nr:hypothetical protein Iba_scaffold1290CG0020 [Ipomoea batatas]